MPDKWFQLQAGAWRWSDAAPDTLAQVRALMFIQRFRADIDQRLAALDA